MRSFFCRFFQFFATEKVNNSNSAHIRAQILHTPGIIWNLYAHNLVRNNYIYYIVCFVDLFSTLNCFKFSFLNSLHNQLSTFGKRYCSSLYIHLFSSPGSKQFSTFRTTIFRIFGGLYNPLDQFRI